MSSSIDIANDWSRAGDDAAAAKATDQALETTTDPREKIALHSLAARIARAQADGPRELRHLEAAVEVANASCPGELGGANLQLGLVLVRLGQYDRAVSVFEIAGRFVADDAALAQRVKTALADARARRIEERGPARRIREDTPQVLEVAATDGSRERVLAMLEALSDADPTAPLEEVLARVTDDVLELVGADRGFVLLAEPDGLKVHVARDARGHALLHPEQEISFSIVNTAAQERRTVSLVRPAEDPRFSSSPSARRIDLVAACAVPLLHRGKLLGVICLDRKSTLRGGGFSKSEELVAATFARGAASLVFMARRARVERATHAFEVEQWARETSRARRRFEARRLVGISPALARLMSLLGRVAPSDVRVLIRGETGTGKELVARSIHENSARRRAPFVAVNCGALTDSVLESELFGHVKGAFTGATGARGLARHADGGTLFLDEIAEASPRLQASLLRFLETGEVRPVGGARAYKVDVRVLSATHESLEELVASGRFREDLLYRLNGVSVLVPPLRERMDDVPLLAEHFARECRVTLTPELIEDLGQRPWPGNVRELRHAIAQLGAVGRLPDLPPTAPRFSSEEPGTIQVPTLEEAKRRAVTLALEVSGWNRGKAAALLGVPPRTLYNLIKSFDLAEPR